MLHVVLYEPEIPPNTGNAIRLCANTGATLHLIHPLGFEMADSKLRRAGLDYRERARVREHHSLEAFFQSVSPSRVFALSTRGRRFFHAVSYRPGDALVFGPETRGLPEEILDRVGRERTLRLPMVPGNRSLNLSNAVAVTVFEAWRQLGYPGSDAAADAGPVYTV